MENKTIDLPIRVLHVIGVMNRGGAETMIMNLYRNIDRDRVQFDFVENTDERAEFDDEIERMGGQIFRCPHYNGINHFEYLKWWSGFFDDHSGEYAAVHGHIGSTAAIYLREAKKHGVFAIAHSHNIFGPPSIGNLVYRLYSFPTRFTADYFFACSEQAGIDRFGKKVVCNSAAYSVFRNAIPANLYSFNESRRAIIRDYLGITGNQFLIGHIGRFAPQKNHGMLVDIFKKIVDIHQDSILLLVGDGQLRPEIEEKVRKLGLREKVLFTGVRTDVQDILQAMDLLLFPSTNEGLPMTLVEAQAAGLPCVISDRVPGDCIITHDLVTVMRLEDPPKKWAEHAVSRMGELRTDHSAEVIEAGFDVRETAKWLEEFYIDKAKR